MAEIEETDYLKTLDKLLKKKKKLLKEPNIFKQKAKLAKYAIGKGFESNLVWEQVHGLFNE